MKRQTILPLMGCVTLLACGPVAAGTPIMKEVLPPPVVEAEEDPVSGSFSIDYNTHFISYGADVWGAGTSWEDGVVNPSIEIALDLGGGFSAFVGTWFDMNNNSDSPIGGSLQEVDIWGGIGYEVGMVSLAVTYQEWYYASQTERIVDFSVGLDTILAPSLTVHGRVDIEEGFGETGIILVAGVDLLALGDASPDFGLFSLSAPVAVGFNTADGYFGEGSDTGFGYVSAGLQASVGLPFLPGDWALNFGATYYHTENSVYPANPDEDFVAGNAGLGLSF